MTHNRPIGLAGLPVDGWLLVGLLVVPTFVPLEVLWAIYGLALSGLLVRWRFTVRRAPLAMAALWVVPIASGLISASDWRLADALRDMGLFLVPLVLLVIGSQMSREATMGAREVLQAIAIAGSVISVVLLIRQIPAVSGQSVSLWTLRTTVTKGSLLAAMGPAVMLLRRKETHGDRTMPFANAATVHGILGALTTLLAFSRIFLFAMLVAAVTAGALDRRHSRSAPSNDATRWIRLALAGMFAALLLGASFASLSSYSGTERAFLGLLEKGTGAAVDSDKDYRAWENARGREEISDSSVAQFVFGRGLGATLDLGRVWTLGGFEGRYVPVLHNGITTILIKSGVVGLVAIAWSLLAMGLELRRRRNLPEVLSVAVLALPLLVIAVFATPLNTGVLNRSAFHMAFLVAGWALARVGVKAVQEPEISLADKDRKLPIGAGFLW